MPYSTTDAIPIGETAFYLCFEFGMPCAKTFGERGSHYAPRWTFDLLNAFTLAGYPPDNMKYRPNGRDDISAMKRLVKKIMREEAFDLAEVRAALRLGGLTAALQLGGSEP